MRRIRVRTAVIAQSILTVAAAVHGLAVVMASAAHQRQVSVIVAEFGDRQELRMASAAQQRDVYNVALVGDVLVSLVSVPTIILTLLLHYRCWSAVPVDRARTTPGKAVGFLFIPFFNFYWIFESFAGLAEDLAGTKEHAPGRGLGIALGILTISSLFPGFAGMVLAPILSAPVVIVWFIIWLLYALEVTAQANRRIAEAEAAAGLGDPPK